jgi:hypothetical protein
MLKTRTNPANPTALLKPVFDEAFKHQIGDIVCLREHVISDQAEMHVNEGRKPDRYGESIKYNPPLGMTITGRMMEECHGGIQTHYRMTGFLGNDGTQLSLTMQEFQVCSFEKALNQRRALRDHAVSKEE